jgi:type II secretory pathway pseudopilin PulG
MTSRQTGGFSLIEVIVSAALVTTTAGALFSVASMSVRLTVLGQDRIIASELAREGIESVRQTRDSNFVSYNCSTSGSGCPEWSSGLYTASLPLPQPKHIVTDPNFGFRVTDMQFSSSQACTDYVVRDLTLGKITVSPSAPSPAAGQEVFCRRLVVEGIDLPETAADESQDHNAFLIRSQIAWLGYGKNVFRDISSGGTPLACQGDSTEWCIDQTTILTNWRPSL